MAHLSPFPKFRALDNNGAPLAGGKLYTYAAGTSTPQNTYTDYTGGVANANPVILDANGEANVWLGTSAYKFVLTNASDVQQWSVDNVSGLNSSSVVTDAIADGAVTTPKIADLNVTTGKLADVSVTTGKIQNNAVTTAKIADLTVTRAKLEALGQQVSASSGNYTFNNQTTAGGFTDITNLTVTITTTAGRPIRIYLVTDGSGNNSYLGVSDTTSTYSYAQADFKMLRGATEVGRWQISNAHGSGAAVGHSITTPPSCIEVLDAPGAGTHTYKLQVKLPDLTVADFSAFVKYCKLVAYEL
jgi:hypothetical protein